MTRALAGLNVLITRPQERGAELRAALELVGATVRHLPLLAIMPLADDEDGRLLAANRRVALELDRYHRAICVSATAVEYGLDWLAAFWPQWPQEPAWYGIGAATAKALSAQGLSARQPGGAMNSEALLELPEWRNPTGERVLIVRGVGGREHLTTELRRRGARVELLECYRRVLPAGVEAAQLRQDADWADVICISSGETLASLQQLWHAQGLTPDQLEASLLVPGARVAGLVQTAGFRHCLSAENAGTEATVAALREWWARRQDTCTNNNKLHRENPGRD